MSTPIIHDDKVRFFIPPDLIEAEALQQIRNTASMPFVYGLAVMPDVHFGLGSTVGTVVATEGAVMPAAVGVDIGCGMIATRTSLTLEQVMPLRRQIRMGIERRIPVGVGSWGSNKDVQAGSTNRRVTELWQLAEDLFGDQTHMNQRMPGWERQIGSLGGGNHFIEVCAGRQTVNWDGKIAVIMGDMSGAPVPESVWVILHSGSRGVGNKTGNHWIKVAKGEMGSGLDCLPDRNLAYLVQDSPSYISYMKELHWCQEFARLNREEMMDRVLTELIYTVKGAGNTKPGEYYLGELKDIEIGRVNSHHNYTSVEEFEGRKLIITRKGAIFAGKGKRSLIPGSMGTNSYIVEGKGNEASFNSAPHGAGRRMSRTQAKATFTVEQVAAQMEARDIECRMREAIIDEAPGSYKDIEETIHHAQDLIHPVYQLRQVLNVKGD
jgi:tRNA-splicing ligase RtcB